MSVCVCLTSLHLCMKIPLSTLLNDTSRQNKKAFGTETGSLPTSRQWAQLCYKDINIIITCEIISFSPLQSEKDCQWYVWHRGIWVWQAALSIFYLIYTKWHYYNTHTVNDITVMSLWSLEEIVFHWESMGIDRKNTNLSGPRWAHHLSRPLITMPSMEPQQLPWLTHIMAV